MEITNQFSSVAINQISEPHKQSTVSEHTRAEGRSNTEQVSISNLGMLSNEIDNVFDQMDNIYTSKLSQQQKSALESYYKELDQMFEKQSFSHEGEAKVDELFDKIDALYSQSEQQFTAQDWQALDKLNNKADHLIDREDSLFERLDDQAQALESEQEDLLVSQLSSKEKQQLADYHQQLNSLFNATKDNDEASINKIFDKIDSILNAGFEKLSDDEKKQFKTLEEKLDGLYSALVGEQE